MIKGTAMELSVLVIMFVAILMSLYLAKKGREIPIRSMAGLDAIDEAVRRCTEMKRPIMVTTGIGGAGSPETIAGIAVVDHVARQCAKLDTPLIATTPNVVVLTLVEGVIGEAYTAEGKPEVYSPGKFTRYFGSQQFSFVAGVAGIFEREKPGAAIYFGYLMDEMLFMPEIGSRAGAFQVGGCTDPVTIGELVIMCDYTLFGEEIYAAAATLTGDPEIKASILAQDVGTWFSLVIAIGGVVLTLFGWDIIYKLLGW